MSIIMSGISLGNIAGGPSSIKLEDLANVAISSPIDSQYLTYNGLLGEWENTTLDFDASVYSYLDGAVVGTDGITVTASGGTITLGLDYEPVNAAGDTMTGNLTVPSINSGQLAGTRNRLINGGFQFGQRGNVPVTAGGVYGADRWIHFIDGGTGISATGGIGPTTGSVTRRYGNIGGNWTNGKAGYAQRIEAVNTRDLGGKTVTLSGKIYHNLGAAANFIVNVERANTIDSFGSRTQLFATTVTAANDTFTSFSLTGSLGSTDGDNGLQINIIQSVASTVVNKSVGIADMQLELGPVATPFEHRSYGLELMLCQRYYSTAKYAWTLYGLQGNGFGTMQPFPVMMRTTPTVAIIPDSNVNVSTGAINANQNTGITPAGIASSNAMVVVAGTYFASAEL